MEKDRLYACCPVCRSEKIIDLQKHVRGCDQAKVFYCRNCQHGFLTDCTLGNDYYRKEYDTFLSERSKDTSWMSPKEHVQKRFCEARERIQWLSHYIKFGDAESILELGCSSGAFLLALKELYPEKNIQGVEPSDMHRQCALDLSLKVASSNMELKGAKFDVIIAFFVLEHILNPGAWLKELCLFADKGSRILMIVPNGREALVSTYPKSNYDQFVWQAPHVSYFSQASLELLFKKNIGRSAKVYQYQRYSLNNHLNWLSGIKPEREETYPHVSETVDTEYKRSLVTHGIADTLLGVVSV